MIIMTIISLPLSYGEGGVICPTNQQHLGKLWKCPCSVRILSIVYTRWNECVCFIGPLKIGPGETRLMLGGKGFC